MSLTPEEVKEIVRVMPEGFVRKTRCPTCDTKLIWFEPGSGVGSRLLTALCEKCGITYHIRVIKKWFGTGSCDLCNICACCCIAPEWWRRKS